MKSIIQKNILNIRPENLIVLNEDGNKYIITGHHKVVRAVEELSSIKGLNSLTESLKEISSIYNLSVDKVYTNYKQVNDFNDLLTSLIKKCYSIVQLIDEIIGEQEQNTISIKLPLVNDLSKLADYLKRIEKTLYQLVCNEQINGKVELVNVEAGSIWLDICLGSVTALVVTGSAVWAAAVTRKKFLEGEILKKQIEAMGIKNEALQSIKNQLDNELDAMNSIEVENVLHQNGINITDNEYKNRIVYVVKELNHLIEDGVEIHHSLTTPEEVKNLFPDFSQLGLMESKVLKLEKGNN